MSRSSYLKRGLIAGGAVLLALTVAVLLLAWLQGRRTPQGAPEYVALGSSFAAGAGLGPLEPGSPLLCARSVNGYPQQLARLRRLSIVDMSCGGAMTRHLLKGGQFFQGPQIRTIDPETRLVTITVGGNDVGYVGDLSLLAARKANTPLGWLTRALWKGPKPSDARDYPTLKAELIATVKAVRERAPDATIVLTTYPTLVPPVGTCARIDLTSAEAAVMRRVGDDLAGATREAAREGGAVLVDMHRLGAAHHACAAEPWTTGWRDAGAAPFHPTREGAAATARAISDALRQAGAV